MSSRLPVLSFVGVLALASFARAATVTSPESGGVTYRIGRSTAVQDGTFTPDWVDVEVDGSTWKITPLAGITTGPQTTSGTVRLTLNADGKDVTKGIELELEAVDVENGNHCFTLTFGRTTMMMQMQTDETQTSQDVDFDLHSGVNQAINQPFPSDQSLMFFNQQASGCTGGGGNCPIPDSGPPDCTDQSCKGHDPYDDTVPYGCEQCRWPDHCPPGTCNECGGGGGFT